MQRLKPRCSIDYLHCRERRSEAKGAALRRADLRIINTPATDEWTCARDKNHNIDYYFYVERARIYLISVIRLIQ